MPLSSSVHEVADPWAAQELYHSNGWTDGLPIVPPTAEAVEACLDWAMTPADQLLGIEPVRGVPITAEKLAVNAVMAGCLPMHFPAVLTAFSGMLQPEFLRDHLQTAGWTKTAIAEFIFRRARIRRSEWAAVGKAAVVRDDGDREYAALPSPEHLLIVAAGGPAGGFGAIIPPWLGLKSQAVTVPVGACVDCGPPGG